MSILNPPPELLKARPVANAHKNYMRLAEKLQAVDKERDALARELPKAEVLDLEVRARAELEEKPRPKKTSEAGRVRDSIEDAASRAAETKRALGIARDALTASITKHRAEALPALHERRERARERFLEALDELERAAADFDAAYGDEIRLEHFPSPIRPLQWSRWLTKITTPAGQPLEFGTATAAMRHRFENVAELSDEDRRTIDARQWETAAAAEPELSLDDRSARARNGIRV